MPKTPLELAKKFNDNNQFVKSRIVNYLEHYGDGFIDDAYEQWAKSVGKQLQPKKPLNPEFAKTDYARQHYSDDGTYYDQFINDEDFQKYLNDELAANGEWEDYEYAGIDDDYARSYGAVTNDDQYQSYLKWKKDN